MLLILLADTNQVFKDLDNAALEARACNKLLHLSCWGISKEVSWDGYYPLQDVVGSSRMVE